MNRCYLDSFRVSNKDRDEYEKRGIYVYDLRSWSSLDTDEWGWVMEKYVLVNHFGVMYTNFKIDYLDVKGNYLDEDEFFDGYDVESVDSIEELLE